MDTIPEDSRERALGRDEGDDFRLDVAQGEVYWKQIILCIGVLMVSVLVPTLHPVLLWNFFAPTTKDLSDRANNNVLHAINSERIAGLLAEEDSGTNTIPHSSTIHRISTSPPHGSSL